MNLYPNSRHAKRVGEFIAFGDESCGLIPHPKGGELMRGQALACLAASLDEVQRMWTHAEAVCAEQERARARDTNLDLDALRALLPNPGERDD